MHFFELLQLAVVCGFAWLRGAEAERWGAVSLAASWIGSDVLRYWIVHQSGVDGVQLRVIFSLSGDMLLAIAFLYIAVRFSSLWLGAVLLVQGAQMTLHSVFLSEEPGSLYFYVVTSNLFSAGLLLMLLGGTGASWWGRSRKARRALAEDRNRNVEWLDQTVFSPA